MRLRRAMATAMTQRANSANPATTKIQSVEPLAVCPPVGVAVMRTFPGIGSFVIGNSPSDGRVPLGLLTHAYGLSGNKLEAEKILDQLKKLSKERYVSAYSFALVYLGLGDKEQALRWLEQSYQDRAGSDIGYIRVDPLLDPLRGDPRFEALAEKIVPAAQFGNKATPKQ